MSLRELEKEENAEKCNAFLRAWKRFKALPIDNPNSFWAIAGYHGEPFKPRMKNLVDDKSTEESGTGTKSTETKEDKQEKQNYWGGW